MDTFLASVVLASVLIQGGFYPTIFLGAACILACAAFLGKNRKFDGCEWLLWGLAGLYLLASLAKGYAFDSLGKACLPAACALFLLLYRGLSAVKKARALRIILLSGGLFAGVAILAFCGIVPLSGAVISHRLQFTFQYANAAGSWFAALSLCAQDSEDSRVRRLFPLFATALFLTQSVGALGLYFLLQLVRFWRRRKEPLWQETILIHAVSGGFAIAFYSAAGWITVILLALLYMAGWYWEVLLRIGRQLRLQWVALLAGTAAGVAVLLSQRFSSSLQTLVERIVQILDGLRIIAAYPLLGIGAGNWENFYPYYQSAQYTSAVVHSSIIQIGVDAGIFAIILAVAFLAFAWRRKARNAAEALAVYLLTVHSLLDFTMQFFPINALLLMLLFAGEEPLPPTQKKVPLRQPICLVFGALCAILLYGQMQYKQIAYKIQAQDWKAVTEAYERRQILFGQSPAVRSFYIQALYSCGDLCGIEEVMATVPVPRAEEILFQAQALQQSGKQEDACRLLLEQLERQLYRVSLFERTKRLLLEWGVEDAWLEAYNRIANRANESQTVLGTLKGDQIYIEQILF